MGGPPPPTYDEPAARINTKDAAALGSLLRHMRSELLIL
jgi:hypothetical protein